MPLSRADIDVIQSVGVDYLTIVASGKRSRKRAAVVLADLIDEERARGNDLKSWGMEGYRGFKCGSAQGGLREDGFIIRLSSEVAREHWREVAPIADRITRLDVQTTLRLKREVDQTLSELHADALRVASMSKLRREVDWRQSRLKGSTLYVGSRGSRSFLRLYNKERESKLEFYKDCLRVEMQANKGRADAMYMDLHEHEQAHILILGWLGSAVARAGCGWLALTEGVSPPRGRAVRTDDDRRCRWLAASVAGSVRSLVKHGRTRDMFVALGFSDKIAESFTTLLEEGEKTDASA